MKILILNYEYPPLGGGAGMVSQKHAEELSKLGHKVTVLTTWFKGEKEVFEENNLKIIKLKSKRRKIYKSTPDEWLLWISKSKKYLKEYLKKNTFDFCFAHFALPSGEIAKYINKKFNLPYAVISHGQDIPWFFPKQMFKYHLITYFWIKSICKRAKNLILLTEMMKENADKFMKNEKNKNVIIPNGCDIQNFKPDFTKKREKFTIIFVGRLVEQKAPFTFLNSIKEFDKENIDYEVIILGDGPLRTKMEKFAELNNLQSKIFFKGWVDKVQMLEYYQSANLQVITSVEEAMSIAALESLSTGQYIISTPVSGNTELIEENINGNFVEIGNYSEIAKKIKQYHDAKFIKKYHVPEEYVQNFRKKYNWENIVKELIKVV